MAAISTVTRNTTWVPYEHPKLTIASSSLGQPLQHNQYASTLGKTISGGEVKTQKNRENIYLACVHCTPTMSTTDLHSYNHGKSGMAKLRLCLAQWVSFFAPPPAPSTRRMFRSRPARVTVWKWNTEGTQDSVAVWFARTLPFRREPVNTLPVSLYFTLTTAVPRHARVFLKKCLLG